MRHRRTSMYRCAGEANTICFFKRVALFTPSLTATLVRHKWLAEGDFGVPQFLFLQFFLHYWVLEGARALSWAPSGIPRRKRTNKNMQGVCALCTPEGHVGAHLEVLES